MAGRQISVPPTSAPARPPPSRRRGRPSTEQPRRTQAALLIVGICVFMYFLFSNSPHLFEFVTGASSSSSPTKITDADVAALASTVHMMEESGATLLDEVGGHYAQQVMFISMAMEVELMKLVQADEDDQDGAGDRLHAYIHHPQTVAVVRALEEAAQYMYHSLRTLLVMGDAAHVVVDEEDNGNTPIHERIFDWFAVAVHLHAALLPEVYLQLDNTPRHATVLLRGVHLLSLHLQHISEEMMFGDRPCRHLRHHSTSRWSTFCEGSLNTRAKMLRRIAATLEELIVLYPTCAPLRAHYAVALTLHHLGTREASTTTSAMNVVRSTLEKSEKGAYEQVDEVQMHVLHLLQLVLQQPTTTMEEMEQRWLEKAMGDDQVCSITAGEEWPGTTFSGEAQPPLVHRMGMQILAPHLLSRLTEDDDHAHLREAYTVRASMDVKVAHELVFATAPPPPSVFEAAGADRIFPIQQGNGSTYMCVMPPEDDELDDGQQQQQQQEQVLYQNGVAVPIDAVVPRAIMDELDQRLRDSAWSAHIDSWWSLSFSWNHSITQMHHTHHGGAPTQPIILGHAPRLVPRNKHVSYVPQGDAPYFLRLDHHGPYIATMYRDGTFCELTKATRLTEVRIRCAERSDDPPVELTEKKSCHYILNIHSENACIELLRHPRVSRSVVCYPMEWARSTVS